MQRFISKFFLVFLVTLLFSISILLDIVESNDFSQRSRNEIINLTSSLSNIISSDLRQGEFKVKDIGNQFEIYYIVNEKEAFNKTVTKKDKNEILLFYEVIPIRVGNYSALFLNAYGLVLRYPYSYIIYPNLKNNAFTFYDFKDVGGSATVKDLDSDGEIEIITIEFQEWANSCFSNASRPDRHRIFHVLPQTGKMLDVSDHFPEYYISLYKEYMNVYKQTSSTFSDECYRNYQILIENTKNLTKEYYLNNKSDLSADYLPTLPYINKQLCPIENCVYQTWKLTKSQTVYVLPSFKANKIYELKENESIKAISGEVHTNKYGKILVEKNTKLSVGESFLELHNGDIIYELMHVIGDVSVIWYNGQIYEKAVMYCYDNICSDGNINFGKVIDERKTDWWVLIYSPSRKI